MARQGPSTAEARTLRVARRRTQWLLAFSALLLLLCSREGHAQQEAVDRDIYRGAVEYCRGDVPRPMALRPDRGILCLDGQIDSDTDVSLAKDLKDFGLFVVRSFGGDYLPAIALSDLLRERRATVVIYDYCLSACANYFFFASVQTYVLKGSLVAWRDSAANLAGCADATRDNLLGPKKRPRLPCPDIPARAVAAYKAAWGAEARFYESRRTVYRSHELIRDSPHITKRLWEMYNEAGVYPDVWWTLNPISLQNIFKTKLYYEAYPESQTEVDAIVERLQFKKVFLYDP